MKQNIYTVLVINMRKIFPRFMKSYEDKTEKFGISDFENQDIIILKMNMKNIRIFIKLRFIR